MRYWIWLCTISFFLLSGCSTDHPPDDTKNSDVMIGVVAGGAAGAAIGALSSGASVPVTTVMGGIVGGALASAIDASRTPQQNLIVQLQKSQIHVITMGEDYMLVLPSDVYFYSNSTHFNENMYPAIKTLAVFINQFDVETIKIAGYTDNTGDYVRNLALSRQQAQTIAKELSADGLKSTMVYSIGYGSDAPIATNDTNEGRKANRRIQITFRRLTPGS